MQVSFFSLSLNGYPCYLKEILTGDSICAAHYTHTHKLCITYKEREFLLEVNFMGNG